MSAATSSPFPAWPWWFIPPLLFVLAGDLVSKWWLFSHYRAGASPAWWCELTYNTGVAWGIGHAWPGAVLIMTLVLIPVLAAVWWWSWRPQGRIANLAFGAVLGGALGNAYDRVMTALVGPAGGFQGVRDFVRIDLKPVGLDYTWPNFNLADAAISSGFAMLLLLSFLPARSPAPVPKRAHARGDQ